MKLLLIGSGIRTPLLIHGLIERQHALDITDVVLFDTDRERLETMQWLAGHLAVSNGAAFTVRAEPDLRRAAAGASFIFSSVRVGQEQGRIEDERIALDLGVLGQETTGPGGFAMALRTIPVLLQYAAIVEEVAPDAWFINFTNPAGLITQALRNETSLKVIGICDTPTAMRTSIAGAVGREVDTIFVDYAGLNHLGWVHRVLVDDRDVLPELIAGYPRLQAAGHEWSLFDSALVTALGMLPNEYLYYFYYRERAVANIRRSGSTRGEQIKAINDPLWTQLAEDHRDEDPDRALARYLESMTRRSHSYMARESGTMTKGEGENHVAGLFADEGYAGLALDVMQAIVEDRKAALILNVTNGGCITDLQPEDVIETVCLVDAHGVQPLSQQSLPEPAMNLARTVKTYERLAVRAAVDGDRDAAVLGLTVHPLVCSWSLASELVDRYLSAHEAFLPQFR